MYDIHSLKKDTLIAANGIADIYEFHNIDIKDLTEGKIVIGGQVYQAENGLTFRELELIAKEAYNNNHLASLVEWIRVILKKLKEKKNTSNLVKSYR